MYYNDNYNPADPNDYDNDNQDANEKQEKQLLNIVKHDKGLNIISRQFQTESGKIKNKRIKVYTSGDVGSNIRDAETGEYYSNKVGSNDEHLFFTTILATGECKNSSTLFYISPQHCMSHLNISIDPEIVANWEVKRNMRLKELKKPVQTNVLVN